MASDIERFAAIVPSAGGVERRCVRYSAHLAVVDTLRGELREEKEYAAALHESKADAERLLSKKIGELVDARADKAAELEELAGEFEAKADRLDAESGLGRSPRPSFAGSFIRDAAIRLRERAAELRKEQG